MDARKVLAYLIERAQQAVTVMEYHLPGEASVYTSLHLAVQDAKALLRKIKY